MRKKKPLTPLDHASKLRYDLIEWYKLTEKDLTEKDKKGIFFLMHIIKYGHWTNLPPKLKEFSLTQPAIGKDKIIHLMAREGKVNTIPEEFITEELLSLKGNNGDSVYYVLAQEGYADHIDKSLWTRKALTTPAYDGYTPLHALVQHKPELLPEDITLDDLLQPNGDGEIPLYSWVRRSHWVKIPDKFLTRKSLELKVGREDFETLAHKIAERFKHDQALKSPKDMGPLDLKMKKILTKLSDKHLQSLGKDEDPSLSGHLNAELAKRKMIKELSQSEQCLEI